MVFLKLGDLENDIAVFGKMVGELAGYGIGDRVSVEYEVSERGTSLKSISGAGPGVGGGVGVANGGGGGWVGGLTAKSSPVTMYAAYAKDIVTALLAGESTPTERMDLLPKVTKAAIEAIATIYEGVKRLLDETTPVAGGKVGEAVGKASPGQLGKIAALTEELGIDSLGAGWDIWKSKKYGKTLNRTQADEVIALLTSATTGGVLFSLLPDGVPTFSIIAKESASAN